MALTFLINNGDIVISRMNGQVSMIGNDVTKGQNSAGQAALKVNQDMIRCLSLSRLPDGTTAALNELTGITSSYGADTVTVLVGQYIRAMFAAIISAQQQRVSSYTSAERFNKILQLQVTAGLDQTDYSFFLVTNTVQNTTNTQNVVTS